MKLIFVSNYINHHQIPFCDALTALLEKEGGSFAFVQTMPMEAERMAMGWDAKELPAYVRLYYEAESACQAFIDEADLVLFGGCEEEHYIANRLKAAKPIIRISERLYKEAKWKWISPRGLLKKYKDHIRYRKAPVYLLCAGGYVASDFGLIHAYPKKMFAWGYFPAFKAQDVDNLLKNKGYGPNKKPYLLYAGRFLDWKHPEQVIEVARALREQDLDFHLDIIGGGQMEEEVRRRINAYQLEDYVTLLGFKAPKEVRAYMEQADIFLFPSDRNEGWGAVANEAMNSGCALVADAMIGAVPFLVENEKDALVYPTLDTKALCRQTLRLVQDKDLRQKLGRAAYEKVAGAWNAEAAAAALLTLAQEILAEDAVAIQKRFEIPASQPAASKLPDAVTAQETSAEVLREAPSLTLPFTPCQGILPRSEKRIATAACSQPAKKR